MWEIRVASHTTQKSSGIGPPGTPNELVCDRARHQNPIVSVHMYILHGESQKNIFIRMYITHNQSKEYVSVLMYIPHSQSRETFPFVCTSHKVLCVGSCVKGVTMTHTLPWLTVCFYQLHHTRFDEENRVALGYPSQALLLLEPFAKVHHTFSKFISLQLIIPVLHKFTFHIEQLFANFISVT